MTNKNFNEGQIDTGGGSLHIGDNVTYIIDGLSIVLNEYKEQLKNIEQLINEFKPKTALQLLGEIEPRINDSAVNDNKISSKILFLKAICKSELIDYSAKTTANEFVKAYLLNKTDKKLKEKACVEYLNLDNPEKSLELVKEIIAIDENNLNAWFVKILTAKSIDETIKEIPSVVLEDYNFQLNLIYWIVKNSRRNFVEDLEKLDLKLNIDLKKYKKLTFQNKQAWIVAIDLLINKIFNEFPIRYVAGKNFLFEDEQIIDNALVFLEAFINPLKDSEVKESIYHQSFFYYYFKYYKTKDGNILKNLELTYSKLPNLNWFYTMTFCQALNHNEDLEKSLSIIEEYEGKDGEKISEFFLFKATLLFLSGRRKEIPKTFDDYLDFIEVIDERVGFNILNAFLNTLAGSVDKVEFNNIYKKVFSKSFKTEQLKSLFEITCLIRYTEDFDEEKLHEGLQELVKENNFDYNYKDLLAENLQNLGKTVEAIEFIRTYLDKTKISPSLRFYILLLEKLLAKNKESGRGIYKELLQLLTFYRSNIIEADEELLGIEHNLNLAKNDWKEVKNIDFVLYKSFPSKERYLFFYLISLEKLQLFDEIKEVSKSISENFANESIGVQVSKLLLRNNIDKTKGAQIMYNIALEPSNTEARKFYLGISHLFGEDFFKQYDTVEKGLWVKYSINIDKIEEVKIVKTTGIQKELLGRKVGDKFVRETSLTGGLNTIEVLNVYNDALKLHYDIQKEAQNPMNDLGFASLQIPEKIEDFEKFLIQQFGPQQSQEKVFKEKLLNDYYNYRIGFTEIIRSVFRNNPIEAYLVLTSYRETKFTTLPVLSTKVIQDKRDFGLDFTSLMLFFYLDKDLDFKFTDKFKVSYVIKEWTELLLIEEKSSKGHVASINIDLEKITRFLVPENYKENRIAFFESLLDWIDNNCIIDLVEEKLDISYKLDENLTDNDFTMKLMVDNMHLCMRENNHLISSDSSLYLFQVKSNLHNNIISPEKYLLRFFPNKCNTEFYRYLLRANYIGIDINLDTLKNEFHAMLVGNENYFNRCLENLSYSIHNNPNIMDVAVKFLKELYLMSSVTIENKNLYSFEIFKSTFYGMPKNLIQKYEQLLKTEFTLLGDYYDEVLTSFVATKALYKI